MAVLWTPHERDKPAQLLCCCQEHFVFIIGILGQERYKFRPGALLPQCQGNGGQPSDAVQAPDRLITFQLITALGGVKEERGVR